MEIYHPKLDLQLSSLRPLLFVLVAACGAHANAQSFSRIGVHMVPINLDIVGVTSMAVPHVGAAKGTNGTTTLRSDKIYLTDRAKLQIVSNHEIILTPFNGSPPQHIQIPDGLVLPSGQILRTEDGERIVIGEETPNFSVALYPFAQFESGGQLPNGGQAFKGGTSSVTGGLAEANISLRKKTGGWEAGGFYWGAYTEHSQGNLYEGHLRYFLKDLGFQVAYLNDTLGNGSSAAFSFLYDIHGNERDVFKPGAVTVRAGLGLLADFSPEYGNFSNGISKSMTTVGPQIMAQFSVQLSRNLSAIASTWYIRDRDVDLTRLAAGFGYQF